MTDKPVTRPILRLALANNALLEVPVFEKHYRAQQFRCDTAHLPADEKDRSQTASQVAVTTTHAKDLLEPIR